MDQTPRPLTKQCEVDVFEGYASCAHDATVNYTPRDEPDTVVPLCVEHAKQLAKQQYGTAGEP